MSLETKLFGYLSTVPALSALIGTRLYPQSLPQEPVLPAATYLQVSAKPGVAHDGYVGWGWSRFQFDCYGVTPLVAVAVANALKAALIAWRAADPDFAAWEESRQDLPEPELGRYRKEMDVFITHKE